MYMVRRGKARRRHVDESEEKKKRMSGERVGAAKESTG